MPPSALTLLGLVRHMVEVERHWFRRIIAGQDVDHRWSDDGDFQSAFVVDGASRSEVFRAWREELASARRIEANIDSLDASFWVPAWGTRASLRAILAHVTHDQVRHNGHADLLREGIDGVTGT